jgi:MFS family permease
MANDRLLTRPFVLCSAANVAQGVAFNLFLHFPGYLNELGASDTRIGLIWSVTAIAAILARPPIGRTMDTRGRRPVILWGGVLNTIVCSLYLTVTSLDAWIYVVRIAHGVAEAMLFTALFTYAADHVPAARRTQGLALFGVSGMLSITFGGLLGEVILVRGGFDALFVAATVLAGLSFLVSLPLRDDDAVVRGDGSPSGGLRAAFVQRDLQPIWWIGTVFAIALASIFGFLKRFADDTGLGSVGSFFTAYTVAAIAMRVFFGWLPDRVGPKRVLYPSLGALVAAFFVMAWADNARDVVLAGVLFGVGHGMTFPILFGILVTRARDAERGSAMAIFTALFDLGMLVGGPTFGYLIDRAGYGAMYGSAAIFVAVGTAVFWLWDRRD